MEEELIDLILQAGKKMAAVVKNLNASCFLLPIYLPPRM